MPGDKTGSVAAKYMTVMTVAGTIVGVAGILSYNITTLLAAVALLFVTAAVFLLTHYERRSRLRRVSGITLYSFGGLLLGAALTLWAAQNVTLYWPQASTGLDPNGDKTLPKPVLPVLGNHYKLQLTPDTYYDFDAKMADLKGGQEYEIKQGSSYFGFGDYSHTWPNKSVTIIPTESASYAGCETGTRLHQTMILSYSDLEPTESVCIKSSKGLWVVLRRLDHDSKTTTLDVKLFHS